jgi:hypothetical protein
MPSKLPTVREQAKTATNKRNRKRSRKARPLNQWTRERLDYKALEAAKVFVDSILYKDVAARPPYAKAYKKEIKFSVLPWSNGGYIDIRVYINGNSTGQGVLIHLDHFLAVKRGVELLDREIQDLRSRGLIGPSPDA